MKRIEILADDNRVIPVVAPTTVSTVNELLRVYAEYMENGFMIGADIVVTPDAIVISRTIGDEGKFFSPARCLSDTVKIAVSESANRFENRMDKRIKELG